MKPSLIFFFFVTFSIWSKPIHISITLKDAITLMPIQRIHVEIKTEKGMKVGMGYSDENGIFKMQAELPSKKSSLYAYLSDSSGSYERKKAYLYFGKDLEVGEEYRLLPSKETLNEWYKLDDLKFGSRYEGSQANDGTMLISGCSKEEYKDASFEGGLDKMQQYILYKTEYPQESIEMGHQGRVYVEFIVEKSGEVSHVKIISGISPELNAEAYRLIKIMPPWIPGECNGEQVRTVLAIPINFSLE